MKIAITATGGDLEATVDPRFGRCPYFLFVETDDMSFEAVENPNVVLGGGAGIQSAQLMAEKGAQYVLTGNCGPNAHQTLSAAGVAVAIGFSGGIRDAIEQFKAGQFTAAGEPNVASHFGMGNAAPAAPTFGAGQGMGGGMGGGQGMGIGGGRGMGMGGGRGQGMGGGRGMGIGGGRGQGMGGGRGMGMGGGRGQGMGGGRGMGMGQGMGMPAGAAPNPAVPASGGDELTLLKQQAEMMGQQMQQILARIQQLEQDKPGQ